MQESVFKKASIALILSGEADAWALRLSNGALWKNGLRVLRSPLRGEFGTEFGDMRECVEGHMESSASGRPLLELSTLESDFANPRPGHRFQFY